MTPTTTTLVVFLMTWLAALRLTRLAIGDTISRPFREALASREARQPWRSLTQLFDCPWCIGFWISAAVTAVSLSVSPAPAHLPIWFALPAMSFALSWCVGALAFLEATIEDVHHHLD